VIECRLDVNARPINGHFHPFHWWTTLKGLIFVSNGTGMNFISDHFTTDILTIRAINQEIKYGTNNVHKYACYSAREMNFVLSVKCCFVGSWLRVSECFDLFSQKTSVNGHKTSSVTFHIPLIWQVTSWGRLSLPTGSIHSVKLLCRTGTQLICVKIRWTSFYRGSCQKWQNLSRPTLCWTKKLRID
jgi:hypothetical protein